MDLQSINQLFDYFGCCGFVVGPEQRAALQNSLVILRKNHKFSRVQFWGKILGVADDYYIAQGFTDDNLTERKTLYSKNCIRWGLLNPASEETLRKARLMSGRFTGNPSFEAEQRVFLQNESGDGWTEETMTLKEEDRLAAVVADIDHDVVIVPRRSFIKSATGQVLPNKQFQGHTVTEAGEFYNYMHYRRAERVYDRALLDRADYERAIDFMDSIEDDVPKGSWSIQREKVGGYVLIKSLLWLGYNFFHVPNTPLFGSVYVGTGEKNIDLPFML